MVFIKIVIGIWTIPVREGSVQRWRRLLQYVQSSDQPVEQIGLKIIICSVILLLLIKTGLIKITFSTQHYKLFTVEVVQRKVES